MTVLFDLDGVLVDSEAAHHAAYTQLFAPYGVVYSPGEHIGRSRRQVVEALLPDLPAEECKAVMARKDELVRAHVAGHGVRAFPGAVPFLRHVRQLHRVGLVTSGSSPRLFLGAIGVRGLFDVVVDGTMGAPKPAPDLYRLAMEQLGDNACVAVEDSVVGVAAAKAAGCRVVAITHTTDAAALGQADQIVHRFSDITL